VVVAGIALFTLIVAGIAFDPLVKFVPAWNLRAGLMVISVGLGAVTVTRLRRNAERWAWCGRVLPAIGIGVVALLLALFTGETRDYYELLLTTPDLSREAIERLNSIQQLALSGVWLVFSLCLIGFGIWRGLRMPRLVAIALFGFTILKIFIYDLSFLQTLYRIFSFVGLGVILLTVSYAYQRYKYIILPERVN
jgi:uncharacterized membrane protein